MNGRVVSTIADSMRGMRVTLPCRIGSTTTLAQFYSNLFTYRLYIGVCLLLMLIYSVMYLLLAEFVERVNPGRVRRPATVELSLAKIVLATTIEVYGSTDEDQRTRAEPMDRVTHDGE